MFFTIATQIEWHKKMMLHHGHESGVSIDATFGTNDKKVTSFLFALGIGSLSNMYKDEYLKIQCEYMLHVHCCGLNLSWQI
jgi:hypothetical protein